MVRRYGQLVRACARPLFLAGGDSEDLIQEGMLGLLAAIRSFDPDRDAAFRTYAEICVRSRLHSAVRAAQGGKHAPLNHSVSFEPPLFDGTNAHLFSSAESPEDVIIGREELKERLDALKGQLSELEAKILPPYLNGLTCGEIARRVGRPQKSVDNAIQRIRRKVARQFSSGVSSES
ncbi:sigma-70 family RNA polymerase sigma factor [Pseudoflavonifractor phocaeensis]|uniref:sigma-70 family RNA polymerase sigma factor n=1 Tax=Pseudoflavonifractor phocaeensis TaxID=1870988 RepID=UPI001F2ED2A3|nr:sigma-70 family RNA polymerase sigma factor [Pseudoflavonifractor phocaeensis]MDY3905589.1 sigma-70 family RNA polymerase sigma factor [Lawsonibacter sp.]